MLERSGRFLRSIGRVASTIWVGRVMNIAELVSASMRGWVPLVPDEAVWPMIKHLNGLLEQQAGLLGDTYLDISVERFGPKDFIDEGHFRRRVDDVPSLLAPGAAMRA